MHRRVGLTFCLICLVRKFTYFFAIFFKFFAAYFASSRSHLLNPFLLSALCTPYPQLKLKVLNFFTILEQRTITVLYLGFEIGAYMMGLDCGKAMSIVLR